MQEKSSSTIIYVGLRLKILHSEVIGVLADVVLSCLIGNVVDSIIEPQKTITITFYN